MNVELRTSGNPTAVLANARRVLGETDPADPLTLIGAVAGITLVALGASLIPARRTASVDPIVALRCE